MKTDCKYFIIDGKIEIRFAVSGDNEEKAKANANRMVKSLLDTGLMGSCGWNFNVEKIVETKPIE